jgi:hypothetical protein
MVSCNPPSTPMSNIENLSKEEGTLLSDRDNTHYRSLVEEHYSMLLSLDQL